MSPAKPDWSRPLPEPIEVGRRKLRTLLDVSRQLQKAPPDVQATGGWRHATNTAIAAAEGRADVRIAVVAFKLAGLHR